MYISRVPTCHDHVHAPPVSGERDGVVGINMKLLLDEIQGFGKHVIGEKVRER